MQALSQQIRFCTSHDGVRIAYATSGAGPPIVKAANWLSHLEFDGSSPVWLHLLRELSERNTLIRYDARGCGLSDWNVEPSFEAWVRDLETVAGASASERFALLGISQGASIAIAYAVRHPEKVSHLIVHGGYARGRLNWPGSTDRHAEAETMIKLAELGWGQENPAFRQFFTTQFIPDGTPKQHQWFNELERISTSPANAARFMRVLNGIDIVSLLPQVSCPTLVFHSIRDARVPFDEGRLVAGTIPRARFVPLESNNQLPRERRWLAMCGAGGPGRGWFERFDLRVRRTFLSASPAPRRTRCCSGENEAPCQPCPALHLVNSWCSGSYSSFSEEPRGDSRPHGRQATAERDVRQFRRRAYRDDFRRSSEIVSFLTAARGRRMPSQANDSHLPSLTWPAPAAMLRADRFLVVDPVGNQQGDRQS